MSISESNFPFGIKSVSVKLASGNTIAAPATVIDLVNLISDLVNVGNVSNVIVESNQSPMIEKWQEEVAAGKTLKSYQDWLES